MPANHKVFVWGPGAGAYMRMFLDKGYEGTNDIDQASIICFTGGEDVAPGLYGEVNATNKHGQLLSVFNKTRDDNDALVYGFGCGAGAFMVGICRGAQFLNVMNGGKMWQHVDGHAGGPHDAIDTITGEVIRVSSTHHQMMRPADDGEVLLIARESTYRINASGTDDDGDHDDPEVVWYPSTKCLCFQPHPEHIEAKECREYFFNLLERFL